MLNQIILGILQGIFEWLPVSSEGIVALASQYLINDINPVDFALFLHLGTMLAVLIYFRKDWLEIATLKNKKIFKFLAIATILSLVIGFPLYQIIRDIAIGSALLALVGIGLLITSYFNKNKKSLNLNFTNLAITSGILQGLAIIPGLSRSGSTIFGLSLGNLKPKEILKISYIMSLPVILASNAYIMIKEPIITSGYIALATSFVVGYISLHYLMKFSEKIKFYKFTLVFGILCLLGAIANFVI